MTMGSEAGEQCGKHVVQAGTDGYCTKRPGHTPPCVETTAGRLYRDGKRCTCGRNVEGGWHVASCDYATATATGREGESLKGRAAFSPGRSVWRLHDTALVGDRDERVLIVELKRHGVRVLFLDLDLRLDVPYGALREER